MEWFKFVIAIVGFAFALIVNVGGKKLADWYVLEKNGTVANLYFWGCFAGMLMYFIISISVRYIVGMY